jgi:transcriptional regulator with XRE-family HTH domain
VALKSIEEAPMAVGFRGKRMKELRELRGLERRELARLAGVGYTTVQKMEARDYRPRSANVKAVAKVLKVRPEELQYEIVPGVGGNEETAGQADGKADRNTDRNPVSV